MWRVGSKPVRIAARRKRPVGTTFSFRLDQPAKVTLAFTRKGSRKAAGTIVVAARKGANRVRFQGRLTRTRTLGPGRYTLEVGAANAAGRRAVPRHLTFTIADQERTR